MNTPQPAYEPPSTAVMRQRQDEVEALRWLLAQRRLYKKAKRWVTGRWVGMLVIGVGAPVVSVLQPEVAVVVGALAGLWIFLGRTVMIFCHSGLTAKAAAVQEQFDFFVYQMPGAIDRSELPSLEEIARLTGSESQLLDAVRVERLLGWYPLDDGDSGPVSVAIAQRANASYADRLMRSTAVAWATTTLLWFIGLIAVSVLSGMSLLQFLAGVLLPVLPAFLDVVQYVLGIRRAARARRDLADAIEAKLDGSDGVVEGNDLVVWQEQLYGLRKSTPEVPEFVYWFARSSNEDAMTLAARQLSDRARRSGQ